MFSNCFQVWGRFVPEGYLTTCTFDYLPNDFIGKAFVGTLFTFSYILPMSLIIYFYSQIVSHVVNHEKALREQVGHYILVSGIKKTFRLTRFITFIVIIKYRIN